MRMIKLSTDVWVNPAYIAAVTLGSYRDCLYVRMADGKEHRVETDYGKSVWETQGRLIGEINGDSAGD